MVLEVMEGKTMGAGGYFLDCIAPEVTKDPPVEGANNVSNNGALSWLTSWYIAPWGWRTQDSIHLVTLSRTVVVNLWGAQKCFVCILFLN